MGFVRYTIIMITVIIGLLTVKSVGFFSDSISFRNLIVELIQEFFVTRLRPLFFFFMANIRYIHSYTNGILSRLSKNKITVSIYSAEIISCQEEALAPPNPHQGSPHLSAEVTLHRSRISASAVLYISVSVRNIQNRGYVNFIA